MHMWSLRGARMQRRHWCTWMEDKLMATTSSESLAKRAVQWSVYLSSMDSKDGIAGICRVKFVHLPRKKAPSPIQARQPRSPHRDVVQTQYRDGDREIMDRRSPRRRSPPHHRHRTPPGIRRRSRSPMYRRRSKSLRRRTPPPRRGSPRRYPPMPRRRYIVLFVPNVCGFIFSGTDYNSLCLVWKLSKLLIWGNAFVEMQTNWSALQFPAWRPV